MGLELEEKAEDEFVEGDVGRNEEGEGEVGRNGIGGGRKGIFRSRSSRSDIDNFRLKFIILTWNFSLRTKS